MSRCDLIAIVIGLVMAFATFYLVQAIVAGLIAPLIAVFVGASNFGSNAFTIGASEFRYGAVLEAVITFAVALVAKGRSQGSTVDAARSRACPECTSSISIAARRCPYCTAVVQHDAS